MNYEYVVGGGITITSVVSLTSETLSELSNKIQNEVEKVNAILMKDLAVIWADAERVEEYGIWNNETPDTIASRMSKFFSDSASLKMWVVFPWYTDTDSHGNSYSQLKEKGVKATNVVHTFYMGYNLQIEY